KIPEILLDNTDRNRTSPFAFTGNKFEFRAVGSSANCSSAMTVLNTIVSNQLAAFKKEVDVLINKGTKKDESILKILRRYIVESKAIRFEGNGYSDEWVKEAKRRGLSNIQTTPMALDAFVTKKSLKLFSDMNIFSHREAEARHEIMLETYIKKIQIEARIMGDLAINHILPAAVKYQTILANNIEALQDIGMKTDMYATQLEQLKEISSHISIIKKSVDSMVEARKRANKVDEVRERAILYCDKVRPFFEPIRENVDKLEMLIDDELWPIAKYRELVNIR
ncbi:MAG: glutamine synthetase type III, partial [Bacteroidota bacterium]